MYIVIISIVLFLGGFILLANFMQKKDMKRTKEDITTFMYKNPEQWSFSLLKNGEPIAQHNEHQLTPLASTVKMIYAVAFVEAVSKKKLNLNEIISIREVDIFYLPNTDGHAHLIWKDNEIISEEVTLKQIAQGMMRYSSNACTDYLYTRLGQSNLQSIVTKYNLSPHTTIYPLASMVLIPSYLHIEEQATMKQLSKAIEQLSQKRILALSEQLLQLLHRGDAQQYMNILGTCLTMKVQKAWTSKLPASTTHTYSTFMQQLGTTQWAEEEQLLLDELIGYANNFERVQRLWKKGGSTPFLLTYAGFEQTAEETFALSFFLQEDVFVEMMWIQRNLSDFIHSILHDEEFREKVLRVVKEV